ncbi:MAG: hypothetical protein JSV82_08265 [Planctomycetota bacterium]|nr:MAG: hypothetical protein JSV82_08265 [Planctomycetota bacterium]
MVRNRKKKAFYEVIGKTWSKPHYDKILHQEESDGDTPVTAEPLASISRLTRWPKRPKIMQFNVNRIELSIPYQLAVALLLGFILLVLVVFRFGQSLGAQKQAASVAEMPENTQIVAPEATAGAPPAAAPAETAAATVAPAADAIPADVKGNNRIVIQTYQVRAHLEPVSQYFARFGIETEVRRIDNWYYLVTKDKYENPEKPGTDGYLAKQKIIHLGAEYKAPSGYETFGSSPFHDAYGMKFDE